MQNSVDFSYQIGVIADIEGLSLTSADTEFLSQPEIAGIILFSRNYESPEQLTELTSAISELRQDLLICVDQEGGRVQRFRQGFTRLPAMMTLEAVFHKNPQEAIELANHLGWLMALELIERGVHLSFAPVLDIERNISQVIGDRAFAHDAETVSTLAEAFIAGMQTLRMAAVGKHFPGHGAVAADSHVSLPIDERPLAAIKEDMQPFMQRIKAQQLAGIMPAHVLYPQVDQQNTAGFSPVWLQQILRRQLGFNGVIFSDDLSMAGATAAGTYGERSKKAILAGCNALLACNNREAAIEVVATVRAVMAENTALQRLNLSSLIPPSVNLGAQLRRRQAVRQQINEILETTDQPIILNAE